jgi:PilZ domain
MIKPAENMNSNNANDTKRSDGRNSLFLKATVRFPASGNAGEVRVRNLSSGGMMAEAPLQAARGAIVEVQLKNLGWVTGKVAWTAESRFGIAFDYVIDPKLARQSIGTGAIDDSVPHYLRKLNNAAATKPPVRRI